MTEFTTPPSDAIPVVRIGNSRILFNRGKIDNKCLIIEYIKRIGNNKPKTYYWPVLDRELYINYMETIRIYSGHQKEWDELIFDLFNVEVNSKFNLEMGKLLKKHEWVGSVFSKIVSGNCFSKVWKSGIQNIYGTLYVARLLGDARDFMYKDNYDKHEDPTEIPISACIGRNGTKDCLYKINKGIYPDFYLRKQLGVDEIIYQTSEWKGKHYNISEILKNEIVPNVNYMHEIWAAKLDIWYTRWISETKRLARTRVIKCAKKTINDSTLSNENKKNERDELENYRI